MKCTFLYFSVPAKPDIAKNLIEADDMAGRLLQTLLTHFYLKICLS